ncbi:hypothetical protein LCGC14_1457890 [marine sediment metagenome]|uniref:Uncharacterized protein n=1 Tax=marine sediment metagenome TaxID=412755 RepID=A0A0F9K224_9ZZZZ
MSDKFKPFDPEHCPNCGHEGIRDYDPGLDFQEGKQTIRHWCEECGWETYQVYEVVYHGETKEA